MQGRMEKGGHSFLTVLRVLLPTASLFLQPLVTHYISWLYAEPMLALRQRPAQTSPNITMAAADAGGRKKENMEGTQRYCFDGGLPNGAPLSNNQHSPQPPTHCPSFYIWQLFGTFGRRS